MALVEGGTTRTWGKECLLVLVAAQEMMVLQGEVAVIALPSRMLRTMKEVEQ